MSNIILTFAGPSGQNYAATIERMYDGAFRLSTELFQTGVPYASKSISLFEGSGENRGIYTNRNVVADTWFDANYVYRVHDQNASNIAVGAQFFATKNGSEVMVGDETNAYDVYHADIQFDIDTTNSQDEYTVTWFKNASRVQSGVSSCNLQVVDRSTGTNLIATSGMVQIGSTNSWRLDATSAANRQTKGHAYLTIASATISGVAASYSWILGRDV